MTGLESLGSWLWSVFVSLVVALPPAPDMPVKAEDRLDRTLGWPRAGARVLEVSNVNGPVRIVGYDGAVVALMARRTIRGATEAAVAEARERVRMAITEGGSEIRVCADETRCGCGDSDGDRWSRRGMMEKRFRVDVDFELRVPRDAIVTACTINRGDVEVEGMAGEFRASNVNGAISLAGMRGAGTATTVNGPVTARFAASPRAASTFRTINGDIEVRFPPDLSADLRLKTMNGGLYTDFEIAVRPADQPVEVERRNGRNVYRTNRFATVRVGKGGPVLTFEGLNGDVRVLRARE